MGGCDILFGFFGGIRLILLPIRMPVFLSTTKYGTDFSPLIYHNDPINAWPDGGQIFAGTGIHGTVHLSRGRPPLSGIKMALLEIWCAPVLLHGEIATP